MKNISLPIRFGLVTGAVLIAYFLILALFNKTTNPAFSFVNAVITAFGIYEVIHIMKLKDADVFTYGEGFKSGIITGFIATLLFTLFFLFYATEIKPDFLTKLFETVHGNFKIGIGEVVFIVAIMGFATSVVSTLAVMQWFKKSQNITENK